MPKDSKMTKCVLHSIGLQLLVHPTVNDNMVPDFILGGTTNSPFSSSQLRHRGRIRIPATTELNTSLAEASIALRKYSAKRRLGGEYEVSIVDSILNDIVCYNNALESFQVSDIPSGRKASQLFEIDFSQPNAFENLTNKLENKFNEDFYWSLNIPRDGGFVYYSAFAILVVSNRDAVISAIHNQDAKAMWNKQFVSLKDPHETGSVVIECLRPMKNLQFKFAQFPGEYPIILVVIEDQEVFRWLNGKKTSKPPVAMFQQAKQDLRNSLRSSRMKIVEWQIDWASSRLSELLVSLPEKKLEQVEKEQQRIEELYEIYDEITVFQSLHLLVSEFIEREESDISVEEQEVFPNSTSPLTENKKKLFNLKKKITQMENAVQTKLNLEEMIIEKQKVEQQQKIETYFSKLSIFFAVFVVFEVLATFFAWLLPQGDLVGIISFISMIFGIVVLWWHIMSKTENVTQIENQEDNDL